MVVTSDEFQPLPIDSVVSLQDESLKLDFSHHSFLVHQFTRSLLVNWRSNIVNQWSYSGVEAWVLEPGQQWRKGKVRLTIEFCPDEEEPKTESEPEETEDLSQGPVSSTEDPSPLDDIRQSLEQNI